MPGIILSPCLSCYLQLFFLNLGFLFVEEKGFDFSIIVSVLSKLLHKYEMQVIRSKNGFDWFQSRSLERRNFRTSKRFRKSVMSVLKVTLKRLVFCMFTTVAEWLG